MSGRRNELMPVRAGLHPLVQGLLECLPEVGSRWSVDDRSHWLRAASSIFDLLYGEGNAEDEVPIRQDP